MYALISDPAGMVVERMREEARALLVEYVDALERYDRLHLMSLAACRKNDMEAMECYRGLLRETKLKFQAARGRFQRHQEVHNCLEVIHLEDD